MAQYRSTNEIPEISQNQDSETKIQILEGKNAKLQAIIIMYQSLFSAKKKRGGGEEISNSPKPLHSNKNPNEKFKGHSLLSTYYAPDTLTYHLLKFHDNLQVISNFQGRGSKETSTFLMHSAPQSS